MTVPLRALVHSQIACRCLLLLCVCQYANITGYAVAFGLATAVDTLCSQAYGAGSMMLIGLIVQRAACIMVLTSAPIFVVWYYCADLLILLKQDPAISAEAGQYVWRLAPSLIPYLLFELLKKYLIAQRIMKPMIFILLVTSLCHVLLVYLFIYPLGMGFLGAPSATATAQCIMLALGIFVIHHRGYHKQTWPSLSMDIFRGWFAILRFGLPGMLMLCLEWWSFELCALAAGWLGAIQLDSFVVLLQVQSFIFMIPLGLSVAISTVTGNRLGAGQPRLAKQGASVAVCIGLVSQSMVAVVLVLARKQVGRLFSDDDAVVDTVSEVFPITGVMLLFDAMQVVCGGVLRGIGYQSIGAATNLTGFYIFVSHISYARHGMARFDAVLSRSLALTVSACPCARVPLCQGLPLAGVLVWQNWQVKGLVLGLLVATSITASVFITTIARVDWDKESRAAVERATKDRQDADSQYSDDVPQPLPQQQQQQQQQENHAGQSGQRDSAGKVGKEWYMEEKEQKSYETEMAPAAVSAVHEHHSVLIEDEEKKESPSRPLEHINV